MTREPKHTPDFKDVLPHNYSGIETRVLIELARLLGPVHIANGAFERVSEYFIGNVAAHEVQKGGEVYTHA